MADAREIIAGVLRESLVSSVRGETIAGQLADRILTTLLAGGLKPLAREPTKAMEKAAARRAWFRDKWIAMWDAA